MRKSVLFASVVASLAVTLFNSSAHAETPIEVTLEPNHAVLLQSNGHEDYRRLKDLPDGQQDDFTKMADMAYENLKMAIRRDTASSIAIPQEFSEISCGLSADSVAITVGCRHGFYYCNVSLSSDGDLSAGCGKEVPVPATPVDP